MGGGMLGLRDALAGGLHRGALGTLEDGQRREQREVGVQRPRDAGGAARLVVPDRTMVPGGDDLLARRRAHMGRGGGDRSRVAELGHGCRHEHQLEHRRDDGGEVRDPAGPVAPRRGRQHAGTYMPADRPATRSAVSPAGR